jgi:hypothetical protein
LPDVGTYFMIFMPPLLLVAMWLSRKSWQKSRAAF